MKYGLAALGIILVGLGALTFYTPTQLPTAVRGYGTSFMYWLQAMAPKQLAIVVMVIGVILVGVALFLHSKTVKIPNAPYDPYRAKLGEGKKKKGKN